MPLLLNDKLVVNDPWTFYDKEADLPYDLSLAIVSMEHWLSLHKQNKTVPAGVKLSPADKTNAIIPHLSSLNLICIDFPTYTDGRGYSHARLLRKRYKYNGELRAVGDIRADQMLFMSRLGINAFEGDQVLNGKALEPYMTWFEHNYQPSYALPKDQRLVD